MDRRDFFKVALSSVGGIALGAFGPGRSGWPDVLKGNWPAERPVVGIKLFKKESDAPEAVEQALNLIGGMSKIIKSGDTVVIKPNLTWGTNTPLKGEVTNPKVVEGVIRAVLDAGARPIVAEGTADWEMRTTTLFAEKIGLLDICKRYRVKFVDLNNDEVSTVPVPNSLVLDDVRLPRTVVDCDTFISVPVMKTHYNVGVTLGMKNLVGILSPKYYGYGDYLRMRFHDIAKANWRTRYGDEPFDYDPHLWQLSLSAGVVDISSARRVDLTVIDGTFGKEGQAPGSDRVVDIKERAGSYLIIAGRDTVATDSIGAHLMRQPIERIHILRFAQAKGLGNADLRNIIVKGASLESFSVPFRAPYMQR